MIESERVNARPCGVAKNANSRRCSGMLLLRLRCAAFATGNMWASAGAPLDADELDAAAVGRALVGLAVGVVDVAVVVGIENSGAVAPAVLDIATPFCSEN
mmetsp:Transcript_11924/g.29166  ORF Transcript_11924/g.29166 Transcript_11924/m.29166 type:complete len:101 (-) Transcript_11924:1369-1671(-)